MSRPRKRIPEEGRKTGADIFGGKMMDTMERLASVVSDQINGMRARGEEMEGAILIVAMKSKDGRRPVRLSGIGPLSQRDMVYLAKMRLQMEKTKP